MVILAGVEPCEARAGALVGRVLGALGTRREPLDDGLSLARREPLDAGLSIA